MFTQKDGLHCRCIPSSHLLTQYPGSPHSTAVLFWTAGPIQTLPTLLLRFSFPGTAAEPRTLGTRGSAVMDELGWTGEQEACISESKQWECTTSYTAPVYKALHPQTTLRHINRMQTPKPRLGEGIDVIFPVCSYACSFWPSQHPGCFLDSQCKGNEREAVL